MGMFPAPPAILPVMIDGAEAPQGRMNEGVE
jgi:hypothetical protein